MKLSELVKRILTLPIDSLRVADYKREGQHIEVFLKPDQLVPVARFLQEEQFMLEDITAIDLMPRMQGVYHFASLAPFWRVTLRVWIDREKPELPSLAQFIPGANWHERETHDFFGIVFHGHPHLAPLLLPPDFTSHPLLKEAGELRVEQEIWPLKFSYEVKDD